MICPILLTGTRRCQEANCAWWTSRFQGKADSDGCSIKVIALALSDHAEATGDICNQLENGTTEIMVHGIVEHTQA